MTFFGRKICFNIDNNAFSIHTCTHVHVYSFLDFSTEAFVYDNTFPGKSDKKRNNFR